MHQPEDLTVLLKLSVRGDKSAEAKLFELVYGDLKRTAKTMLAAEAAARSFQPTALVNEAYLRIPTDSVDWQSRTHFLAVAARAMRRVLVDHARAKSAQKRPSDALRSELPEAIYALDKNPDLLIDIDVALEKLAEMDPRQAQIVDLRFFVGMSEQETADTMHLSVRTVRRDWEIARVWLYGQLE